MRLIFLKRKNKLKKLSPIVLLPVAQWVKVLF